MAKRIYWESIKKNALKVGIPVGVAGFALLFWYLTLIGAIIVTGYTGDQICAGTIEDPCIAIINFTANEDIFLYPLGYDPWGRDTPFSTDAELESWKMYRSWGKGWREIKLNETCKFTWCGAPPKSPDNKYAFAFREGRNYTIKIEALKINPTDNVKWGFGPIDPIWYGTDSRDIGYNILNDTVVMWNTQDVYYFNKTSGIQFTNHYEDYWSRNIFCLGYYNGGNWIKIKCADELNNFNKDIQTDNLTYVNATLWKDISYGSYDIRFGVGYHLGLDDKNLSITIYIKNIGIDIPFDVGFAWKVKDLDVPSVTTDRILINNTNYELDGNYNLLFKDMKKYINISFPTNQTMGNGSIIYNYSIEEIPIPFYEISDYEASSTGKKNFLRIDWDKNLNYAVKMYGNGSQEDFYTALLINAGHFNSGQEKSTTLYWIDASSTFTANAVDMSNTDVYNFSSMALGAENATRIIIIGATGRGTATTFSSVTVAGQSATSVIEEYSAENFVSLWQVALPTGTTGDVIVTFADPITRAGIGVWALYNSNGTVYDTAFDSNSDPLQFTLNIAANGGVAIGSVIDDDSSDSVLKWAGLTSDFNETMELDTDHHGASENFVSAKTGFIINATSTNPSSVAGVVASWYGVFIDKTPTSTLNNPTDNQYIATSSITFSITPTDAEDTSGLGVDLYGNWSGGWHLNTTNASAYNNTQTNFTLNLLEGIYIYNAEVNDPTGHKNFSLSNYTFIVDLTNPAVSYDATTDSSGYYSKDYILINISASDINLDSVRLNWNGTNETFVTNVGDNYWENKTGLSEGNYTFYGWANDSSGNYNVTSESVIKIDTIKPLISFISPTKVNKTVQDSSVNWIFANVSITEINRDSTTFTLFNSSGLVNETVYTLGIDSINWTGLPDGNYIYNVTVNDSAGNDNSTETKYIYITTFSIWLNYVNVNLSVELNNSFNLVGNSTANITVCIDIDHPDYGINYSCGDQERSFNVSTTYFRNTTNSAASSSEVFSFDDSHFENLTMRSHQYAEVEDFTVNITGVNSPRNIRFFNANETPDMSNLTQFEPLIDRYYQGKLIGSNIYNSELYDGSNSSNITFQNAGTQTVYLLIDEILRGTLDYTFFFNVTGYLFGFVEDYGRHPTRDGTSLGNGMGFEDYDFVDAGQTTAQIDPSGGIMAGNISSTHYILDDFGDGVLNQTLWSNGSCISAPPALTCADETGGNLRIRTAMETGTASQTVTTQGSPNLPLTAFEAEVINFSIVADYNGQESSGSTTDGTTYIKLFVNQVWNLTILDAKTPYGSEASDADLDFMFEKINRTHWRMTMWGTENASAAFDPSSPINIVYNGNQTIIPIDNYDVGILLYAKSIGDNNIVTNNLYMSEISRTLWTRQNSTLISNSVYDSDGDIDQASMEVSLINNSWVENVSLWMSADNGINWEGVTWTDNKTEFGVKNFVFSNQGRNLRFRIDFNATSFNYNHTAIIPHLNISVEEANVSNLVFDWGNTDTEDDSIDGELNITNSPQEINLSRVNISAAFIDSNKFSNNSFTYPHTYKIPLSITSASRGTLEISLINITYNPNPISLNPVKILYLLNSSTNNTLFRIPFSAVNSSTDTANITIDDIRYDYAGGKDEILITLHDPLYTLNLTRKVTMYYSDFYKNLPYNWADDIFFLPRTNSSKNVSAYGQTSSIPLFNITATNYGGMNFNFSIKVNESFSCLNLTWNVTGNTKATNQKINITEKEISSDVSYLSNTQVWFWADLEQCNASDIRILSPDLYLESCCIDCMRCW